MTKPWSISTTLRNPERARNFLQSLNKLEGEVWDKDSQAKFQVLLLQDRHYGLTTQFFNGLSKTDSDLILSNDEIPYHEAQRILESKKYEGGLDMRGRQSFAPLKKLGLVAIKSNRIVITSLGKYFLSENYDLGELFFRSFIKWQLPNPDDNSFTEKDGFNIKPFVGTLHLINNVNREWEKLGNKPVGISRVEFEIFVPTLCNYKNIDKQVNLLINFRKKMRALNQQEQKNYTDQYMNQFVRSFLATTKQSQVNTCINNLREYRDNTVRYFRLTRLITLRGRGNFVDLEPLRTVEIQSLLKFDNAKADGFKNIDDYQDYISDINKPILPWETDVSLKKIITTLMEVIHQKCEELKSAGVTFKDLQAQDYSKMSITQLKDYIESLRVYIRELYEEELHEEVRTIPAVEECIRSFDQLYESELKPSVELERATTLALNALNDVVKIKPNYPIGDDNVPTFTAPANKPDIECFYNTFNSICEVTLLNGRDQWYNEGQPVMRHLRDFEDKYKNKETYALFIAPSLHIDTLETFRFSIHSGYRGSKQKIIPLTIGQFTKILHVLLEIRKKNLDFKHSYIKSLFDNILSAIDGEDDPNDWMSVIDKSISNWNTSLLTA